MWLHAFNQRPFVNRIGSEISLERRTLSVGQEEDEYAASGSDQEIIPSV